MDHVGRITNNGVFWVILSWMQIAAKFLVSVEIKIIRVLYASGVNLCHRSCTWFPWLLIGFFSCRICILFSCIFRKKIYITSTSRMNIAVLNQILTNYTTSISYILLTLWLSSPDMHTGGTIFIRSCPLILWCEAREKHFFNDWKGICQRYSWTPPNLTNLVK